ncbi:hypothetical protein J437_LFUL006509 [Ladona fulva]|uniref:Uncharacterized protein n=1 Tax=Ladona fulva TaxID=123851 RepID=A0A8K0NX57_LADFU|nr:hypothetical protein J437_LFUL006509 [Ladona fulva]
MCVKLEIDRGSTTIVCGYAPQEGCEEEEKNNFWRQLNQTAKDQVVETEGGSPKKQIQRKGTRGTEVTRRGTGKWWEINSNIIRKAGEEILGKTSGKGPPEEKETWCWNEEVQKEIKEKKEAKKRWDFTGAQEDMETYKMRKKNAKRAVERVKAKAIEKAYEEIKKKNDERQMLRIATAKDRASEDITSIRQMKDTSGVVLREDDKIRCRWKEYFQKLLNEENPKGTMEAIFALRQLMERHREKQVGLHLMFIDLEVYDRVARQEVWRCLRKKGVPEKYVRLVKEMYQWAKTQAYRPV